MNSLAQFNQRALELAWYDGARTGAVAVALLCLLLYLLTRRP